jgi:hypothetical protein
MSNVNNNNKSEGAYNNTNNRNAFMSASNTSDEYSVPILQHDFSHISITDGIHSGNDGARKKAAIRGQWETPPHFLFGGGDVTLPIHSTTTTTNTINTPSPFQYYYPSTTATPNTTTTTTTTTTSSSSNGGGSSSNGGGGGGAFAPPLYGNQQQYPMTPGGLANNTYPVTIHNNTINNNNNDGAFNLAMPLPLLRSNTGGYVLSREQLLQLGVALPPDASGTNTAATTATSGMQYTNSDYQGAFTGMNHNTTGSSESNGSVYSFHVGSGSGSGSSNGMFSRIFNSNDEDSNDGGGSIYGNMHNTTTRANNNAVPGLQTINAGSTTNTITNNNNAATLNDKRSLYPRSLRKSHSMNEYGFAKFQDSNVWCDGRANTATNSNNNNNNYLSSSFTHSNTNNMNTRELTRTHSSNSVFAKNNGSNNGFGGQITNPQDLAQYGISLPSYLGSTITSTATSGGGATGYTNSATTMNMDGGGGDNSFHSATSFNEDNLFYTSDLSGSLNGTLYSNNSSVGAGGDIVDSMHEKVQTEEKRRQKRLARNRATAKLRRLRKKAIVETLEQEVNEIEEMLKEIKEYRKGEGSVVLTSKELYEKVINIDQQDTNKQRLKMTSKEKRQTSLKCLADSFPQLINRLWNDFLNDATLSWAVGLEIPESSISHSPATELASELRNDLLQILKLDDRQIKQITILAKHLENERQKLLLMDKVITSIRVHEYLPCAFIDTINTNFRSLISSQQLSQFLEFVEKNITLFDTSTTLASTTDSISEDA